MPSTEPMKEIQLIGIGRTWLHAGCCQIDKSVASNLASGVGHWGQNLLWKFLCSSNYLFAVDVVLFAGGAMSAVDIVILVQCSFLLAGRTTVDFVVIVIIWWSLY